MDKTTGREAMKMAVVGAGSWGTAIGAWLARNGHQVRIWDIDAAVIEDIGQTRRNSRYLPGYGLPENLRAHASLASAMDNCNAVVVAVPSRFFAPVLQDISDLIPSMDDSEQPFVIWGTKGFIPETGELPSDAARRILAPSVVTGALSGPSFAAEVIRGLPAGLDLGSQHATHLEQIADWFRNEVVLIYTTTDVVGVQVGGAVKNIIAIAAGVSDGLGFGINARSILIARGLAEVGRLNVAMGGDETTLMGLSGIGDLVLTCSGDLSRNRRLGIALGKGQSMAEATAEIGQEIEGVSATAEAYRIGKELDVFMPITERVYGILFEQLQPTQAAKELIAVGPSLE